MRRRLPRTLALPVTAALLVLSATPAMADSTIPTTPIPQPADPNQAPISAPIGPQPLGHAVGDAAAALGVLRLLPHSVDTKTILPGYGDTLPKQSALEAGMGLSSAQANSEAYLSYERSIAQSSPLGLAVAGDAPQAPGSLVQTAPSDNENGLSGGFKAPENPLLNVGVLNGQVHARWSDTLGPCVGTISDASTSIASLSLLNGIPTLPNLPLSGLNLPTSTPLAQGFDASQGLQTLSGLLSGGTQTNANGTGSLLSLDNTLASRSVIQLVDLPGTANKAVQSVSTLQAADVEILKGTPLALSLKVVSQPRLTVTSTGDKATSKVEYTAPVIQIVHGDQVLYTLDAQNPTKDIPIGLPLAPLSQQLGPLANLPVVGGLAATAANQVEQVADTPTNVLDLGVLRLSIGELNQTGQQLDTPFKGYQLGASARMLDLQVLPTQGLKSLLPQVQANSLPSSLAQLALGEQIGRAYTPTGGVVCGTATTPAPGGNAAPGVPKQLAYTAGAYSAVPLFWTGTGMLLLGVVLVAALPNRRRKLSPMPVKPSPSPRPRNE